MSIRPVPELLGAPARAVHLADASGTGRRGLRRTGPPSPAAATEVPAPPPARPEVAPPEPVELPPEPPVAVPRGYVWAPGHPHADRDGLVPFPGLEIGASVTLQLLAKRFEELSLAQVQRETALRL